MTRHVSSLDPQYFEQMYSTQNQPPYMHLKKNRYSVSFLKLIQR